MMNERILELAEQAGCDILFNDDGSGIAKEDGIFFDVESFEKFAELMIRECINIAYEYDKPKLSGPGLAIASDIESHFDIYIEEDGRFVK